MKNIILLFSIFIISISTNGQNIKLPKKIHKIKTKEISISNQQLEYEKLFDKEIEKLSQRNWQHIYDIIPEEIPEWFFYYPSGSNNTYYAIGISDPGMEKEKAFNQASIRAKAIITLLKNCEFKNITDDYTNLRETQRYSEYATKFQDYAKADATISFNAKKEKIINKFFTKYNEAIVLLKTQVSNKQKNTSSTSVTSEHMQIFIENETEIEKIEFFNLNISEMYSQTDSINNLKYAYRRIDTEYEINSEWNNISNKFPDRSYNYQNISNDTIIIDSLNIISNRCNKGLWNGYLCTLLSNMTLKSKRFPASLKNSSDNYSSENQHLIRTISKNNLIFNIDKTIIKDNIILHKISAKKIKNN